MAAPKVTLKMTLTKFLLIDSKTYGSYLSAAKHIILYIFIADFYTFRLCYHAITSHTNDNLCIYNIEVL